MFGIEFGGLFGLIVLVLDVWAIVSIFQSSASTGSKVLWIVLVLVLPLIGLLLWLLFGPKSK
ncbi:MAG: PLDc N-terminal domain-containing protein [Chlorobiales bacterium]|nr:PLDc N-terminal domain-containing protein [Chlorobiales bacterium]